MSVIGAHTAARHRPRRGSRGASRTPSWGLASAGAIVAFYMLAYAISWGWSFTLVVNGDVVRRGVGWPTASPALAGPAIAAVVVTVWMSGRVGLADLARRIVRWRFALRWWAATLSPLAFLGIGLGISVWRSIGTSESRYSGSDSRRTVYPRVSVS